jgi:capsular polysaccharide export protein
MAGTGDDAATDHKNRRLFVYNGGFLTQGRVRRILTLAGYDIRVGKPGPGDLVGVWGRSPTSPRGEAVAGATATPVLRVEDAFLRSIRPGRDAGEPPLGLMIDRRGVHFDASVPSDLEHILSHDPLDDGAVLARAREGIERLKHHHLSKYNLTDPALRAPEPGYVLVIDQTRSDASITYGGATESTFREMLVFAQEEHPGARIVIRTHPETELGHRPGHFNDGHAHDRISLSQGPVSIWHLLDGAIAVYTVSSQVGFEAILAGHRPRVFGQPFYAGWGLTADENPVARRQRKLTRNQLFAAAMIMAPTWFDPARDRLCSFEDALDQLEAQVRAFREDRAGYVATGMRLWKRAHLQRAFGGQQRLVFEDDPGRAVARARKDGRRVLVWAGQETELLRDSADVTALRVEDGMLRSKGLGADLVPPISLVVDDLGIAHDPARESRLERLIAEGLPPGGEARAERLVARMLRAGLTKYNLASGGPPLIPKGYTVLVPGQVEDDASVLLGAGAEHTNLALLQRVRGENPAAVILYKPHPDVEAGLRLGRVEARDLKGLADVVLSDCNPVEAIEAADEVWTITSGLGFEALLRGKRVVTTGMPFYAGWGLTQDMFPQPARRRARPTLAALAHAVLIAYPRYVDPVSGLICPPEVAVERLAKGEVPKPGRWNRTLSKVQGLLAGQSWLWR